MVKRYEDLSGQHFHSLVATKPSEIRVSKQGKMWECTCVCGTITVIRADALKSGQIRSCGCKHPRNNTEAKHIAWKGHRGISGTHWVRIKTQALMRNLEFNITLIEVWEQFEKQEGKCVFTGEPLQFSSIRNKKYGLQTTASLDRIDSSLGYIVGNIQWVHKEINRMKGSLSDQDFINLCKKIVDNNLQQQTKIAG